MRCNVSRRELDILTSFSQKAIKEMVNVIVASLARHNELIVEGVLSLADAAKHAGVSEQEFSNGMMLP